MNKKPNLILQVALQTGTNLRDAVTQTVALAKETGCTVQFRYEGIDVYASPDESPDSLIKKVAFASACHAVGTPHKPTDPAAKYYDSTARYHSPEDEVPVPF
jgi:hypothetical protein